MVSIVLPIAVIIAISVYIAIILHRNLEETIGLVTIGTVGVLYISALFGILQIGFYSVILFAFLCTIGIFCGCIKSENKKQYLVEVVGRIFTPAIIVLGVYWILGFVLTRNNIVILSDPQRLWGAYPKALYFTDKLQIGEQSLLYQERTYIPGMPLLVYFFEKFCLNGFSESRVYFVYLFLTSIVMIPAASRLKWNKPLGIFFYLVILFVSPLLFYDSLEYCDSGIFYNSLFIDPILGVTWGGIVYWACRYYKDRTRFSFVNYSFICAMAILLKEAGWVFVLASTMLFIIIYVQEKQFKIILHSILAFIPSVFAYISWRFVMLINNEGHVNIVYDYTHKIIDVNYIGTFLLQLINIPIMDNQFDGSVPQLSGFAAAFFMVFFIAIAVCCVFLEADSRKAFYIGLLICVVSYILYVGSYYVACLNMWNENMVCGARYLGVVLTGLLVFSLMTGVYCVSDNDTITWTKVYLLLFIVAYIALVTPLNSIFSYPKTGYKVNEIGDVFANDIASKVEKKDELQRVYFVYDGLEIWGEVATRVYFDLIGSGIKTNYVTSAFLNYYNITYDDFYNSVMDGYDYVYIPVINEEFLNEYGAIFNVDTPKDGGLYYVDKVNRQIVKYE